MGLTAPASVVSIDELFDFAMHRTVGRPVAPAVPWICENFIDPVTNQIIHLEQYQKRILRRALEIRPDGSSRYNLVVWSQPKKSGKTAIAGAVGAWVACNVETPNEVSCVANDQEQSSGRIFAAMIPTLTKQKWVTPNTPRGVMAYSAICGSMVKAITTNYKGEAGGNQGISLWSELWAYSGERLRRLWEEMTPPPTRKFRMRWIETYAGFKNESELLWSLYTRVFKDQTERELQYGVHKLWEDLPVYELEEDNILLFWDHIPRMPWQTADYYRNQQVQLRPSAYDRMHGNMWQESSEQFITNEMWDMSCRGEYSPIKATYAIDGSKNSDCTALVGCVKINGVVYTSDVYIWEPIKGSEIDQSDVMKVIEGLNAKKLIKPPLYYDPYQLVKLAQDLRAKGIRCEEFSQAAERIRADVSLYKLYKEGKIVNYPHPTLRQHILAASVKNYGDDEIRIIKPETGEENKRKVDAAVAQSMAAYKAYALSKGGWAASESDME